MVRHISKGDRNGQCAIEGELTENRFGLFFNDFDLKSECIRFTFVRWATKKEQKIKKWDAILKLERYAGAKQGSIHRKIEIKGIKKTNRYNPKTTDDLFCIELNGVENSMGWLYGDAYYLVQETKTSWNYYQMHKLIECVEELDKTHYFLKRQGIHRHGKVKKYIPYTRTWEQEERRDRFIWVDLKDVQSALRFVIMKNQSEESIRLTRDTIAC